MRSLVFAAALLAVAWIARPAQADTRWSFHYHNYGPPAPRYYAPPPVYYAPPPVYVEQYYWGPPPVYRHCPPPYHHRPRVYLGFGF